MLIGWIFLKSGCILGENGSIITKNRWIHGYSGWIIPKNGWIPNNSSWIPATSQLPTFKIDHYILKNLFFYSFPNQKTSPPGTSVPNEEANIYYLSGYNSNLLVKSNTRLRASSNFASSS